MAKYYSISVSFISVLDLIRTIGNLDSFLIEIIKLSLQYYGQVSNKVHVAFVTKYHTNTF